MYDNLRLWDSMGMRVMMYVAEHPGQTKSEIIKTVDPDDQRRAFMRLQWLIESGHIRYDDSEGRDHTKVVIIPTEMGLRAAVGIRTIMEATG